jgi:hypothetical protein
MLRVLVVVVLAACGTDAKPAGGVCDQTSDCALGLDCLEIAQFNGSACTVVGKTCSNTCMNDTDCFTLGSNFHCFATCGSAMVCGATAP